MTIDRETVIRLAREAKLRGDAFIAFANEFFRYEPDTGKLFWRFSMCKSPIVSGNEAGKKMKCRANKIYVSVKFYGKNYMAHRIAWAITHQREPMDVIDHINGDGLDNRLANLREATRSQNQQNQGISRSNTSGFKGVSFSRQLGKFTARIRVGTKSKHLGCFLNACDAANAYQQAALKHHGEFANFGKAAHGITNKENSDAE